jgi:RNA polymerase sigma-70 factor, ECF subfamily
MTAVAEWFRDPALSSRGMPADKSLDELLMPILERAYGYALRLTRDRTEAEDLVQDAALAACKGFATFQQGTNFRRWFFQIITNCFYARHRRRRGDEVSVEDIDDPQLYDGADQLGLFQRSTDPARELMSRVDRDAVDGALEKLPEEFRVVASLYFIEDLRYADISAIVNVPVGTVRSRLHRARKILQQQLWRTAVDNGLVSDLRGAES